MEIGSTPFLVGNGSLEVHLFRKVGISSLRILRSAWDIVVNCALSFSDWSQQHCSFGGVVFRKHVTKPVRFLMHRAGL